MTQLSQNGWPASADRNAIHIKNYLIPGTTRNLLCTIRAAPLLIGFAHEFHHLIEAIDVGQFDEWGYNFAVIPGSKDLSNHSSGTAIDLNATLHPWGKIGTFPSAKVPMIRAEAKKYGLRWGGDYSGKKDEMHFEVNITPLAAAALITRLQLTIPAEKK